jgi:hypothetical protein
MQPQERTVDNSGRPTPPPPPPKNYDKTIRIKLRVQVTHSR